MWDLGALAERVLGKGGARIRVMRPDDLDEVLRMIRLHDSDDYKAAKQSFAQTRFDMPQHITAHFVIIDPEENRPVGVSGYYLDDLEARGLYWLGWTYVNPFFRGRGLGGKLMRFVLEAVREAGGRKIYLSTSSLESYATAVGFYERHGFIEEGRLLDYYADGEHQLIMGKHLGQAPAARASYSKRVDSKREQHGRRDPLQAPARPVHREDPPAKPGDSDDVIFEF